MLEGPSFGCLYRFRTRRRCCDLRFEAEGLVAARSRFVSCRLLYLIMIRVFGWHARFWHGTGVSSELAHALPGRLLAEVEVPCSLDYEVALAK